MTFSWLFSVELSSSFYYKTLAPSPCDRHSSCSSCLMPVMYQHPLQGGPSVGRDRFQLEGNLLCRTFARRQCKMNQPLSVCVIRGQTHPKMLPITDVEGQINTALCFPCGGHESWNSSKELRLPGSRANVLLCNTQKDKRTDPGVEAWGGHKINHGGRTDSVKNRMRRLSILKETLALC